MARGYLGRLPELTPAAQAELGGRIAAAVQAQTAPPPPPGTPVPAYLVAVLAERHRREQARLMAGPAVLPSAAGLGPGAAGAWAAAARPAVPAAPAGQARAGEETTSEPAQPARPPGPGTGFMPPR
jgi:hypothetical protein